MDDEDYAGEAAPHEALQQLEAWRRQAEAAVIARHNGRRVIGGISDWDEVVREELVREHGEDIAALIEQSNREKSRLEARKDADDASEVAQTGQECSRLKAVDDALDELTHVLDG